MENQFGRATVVAALGGLVIGGIAGWYVGTQQPADDGDTMGAGSGPVAAVAQAPAATLVQEVAAKYGFESDQAIGWACGDYERALACKGVGHSNELHKEGLSALKFDVDLSGSSERRAAGEIWVDVNNVAPAGVEGPVNLEGRTITAWVYATPGSLGDKERPNGFQLFVKDKNWIAKYGPWQDVQEGQWMQVEFPVGTATPDFDPTQVNAIGLKMATGEGSKSKVQATVFVDAVNW